jgi:hypothetical protein
VRFCNYFTLRTLRSGSESVRRKLSKYQPVSPRVLKLYRQSGGDYEGKPLAITVGASDSSFRVKYNAEAPLLWTN